MLLIDARAAFFYSGGAWIPIESTLFVTSSLMKDSDPAAVSSTNHRTEITELTFSNGPDKDRSVSRDRVRFVDKNYMPAGYAIHPTSDSPAVIVYAQGSLKEPGGLVKIDVRCPHKATMLLNNFHSRPFNSPCDIAANLVDGCVYFTNPAYGFERGFCPKPRLPSGHIYRYDSESANYQVVAHGLSRPASLAFSPDFSVLYVSELADKYGEIYISTRSILHSLLASVQPQALTLAFPAHRPANTTTNTRLHRQQTPLTAQN